MPRWTYFAIFLVIALGIVAGWHYYLWLRLVRDPGWTPQVTRILTGVLVLLGLSLPLGMITARLLPPAFGKAFGWFAFVWMGGGFLLLCAVAVGDLFTQVLSRFTDLGASMPDAEPESPSRRLLLARTLAAGTTLAAASTTIYGVRGALGAVQVKDVEVQLDRLPREISGLTVVQLTDVHVGSMIGQPFVEGLVERVNALKPDLVVITGDLVDGPAERLGAAVAPLGKLESRWGTHFVTGNHEYFSGFEPWRAFLASLGIEVLENRRVTIGEAGGPSIDLAGIPDPTVARMGNGAPDLAAAVAGRDPERELLVLAHQPRAIDDAVTQGAGLLLSGHTHGGQIWPFGLLVALNQPYVAGLHRREDTQVYVSRGTGFWGPPMRVGAPAEITRLVLTPS
ncbi:MAG: metallophosphoesterase [Deltaproteobacteria bacterium]|nr:metallophosphoesterase [Deltaproteobacteria bacterium]